jgi:hypothetical protein
VVGATLLGVALLVAHLAGKESLLALLFHVARLTLHVLDYYHRLDYFL